MQWASMMTTMVMATTCTGNLGTTVNGKVTIGMAVLCGIVLTMIMVMTVLMIGGIIVRCMTTVLEVVITTVQMTSDKAQIMNSLQVMIIM